MVKLELKQLRLRTGQLLDYRMQLVSIIKSVYPTDTQGNPKPGFFYDDMKQATEPLADKIEASNGSVELTAAEVMELASKVERFPWAFSDKAIIQLIDDVRALTTQ